MTDPEGKEAAALVAETLCPLIRKVRPNVRHISADEAGKILAALQRQLHLP